MHLLVTNIDKHPLYFQYFHFTSGRILMSKNAQYLLPQLLTKKRKKEKKLFMKILIDSEDVDGENRLSYLFFYYLSLLLY